MSLSESEDSEQAAVQRANKFEAKTGISEATMQALNYKKQVEDEQRATSKERQVASLSKQKASTLHQLAEQVRMVFMNLQNGDVNSMSLDRLLVKLVDGSKMLGNFRSRGK